MCSCCVSVNDFPVCGKKQKGSLCHHFCLGARLSIKLHCFHCMRLSNNHIHFYMISFPNCVLAICTVKSEKKKAELEAKKFHLAIIHERKTKTLHSAQPQVKYVKSMPPQTVFSSKKGLWWCSEMKMDV